MYVSSNTSSSSSYNSTANIPDFVASTSSSNSFSSSMNDKLSSSNTNDTASNNKTDSTTSSDNKTNDTSKDSVNNKEGEKTSESKKEDKKEVDEEAVAVATTVENVDTSNMDLTLLQMLEEAIKSTEEEVAETVVAGGDVEFQVVTMTDLKVAEMVVDQTIKAEVAIAGEVTAEEAMVMVDEDGNPVEVEEKEEVEVKAETKETSNTKVSEQETKEVAKVIEKVEVVEEKEVVSEKADTKVVAKATVEGETEELEVEDVQLTADKGISLDELATEEKILIKVGNTTLSESWQKLADDLGKEILAKAVQGEDSLSVTLNPKGLGEIQVEIAKQDNGVSVSLMCSSKTTAGLLSENIAGLVRILEDNFEEHTVVVENSDQAGNQGLSDQDESRGGEEQEKEEKEDNEQEFALDLQSTFERMRLGIS